MKRILEGLRILIKYYPKGDIVAQHDIIYAGGVPDVFVEQEDVKRLEELGWYPEDDGYWFINT